MIDACYIGDVRDGLRSFIAAGIRAQTCVTSPPYWGLRDYGTAQWDGGDADCDHIGSVERLAPPGTDKQASNRGTVSVRSGDCACGARRIDRQIGLEPTIAEYVATMVDVFRLVRDVLADDGTLWLNLGDSYSTQAGSVGECPGGGKQGESWKMRGAMTPPNRMPQSGLKPKDLCMIPARVALALQADGWYLRSDIIWAKPNPMPESVTDRPTKSHEYLFLLAKSERYYYDAAAIREPHAPASIARAMTPANPRTRTKGGNGEDRVMSLEWQPEQIVLNEAGANKRTVWTIATQAFPDAHFATFPRALVEPCILAGSRVGDTVLDPFLGSGTVAQVAQDLGRRWIGCELNEDYVQMQHRRTAQGALVLA